MTLPNPTHYRVELTAREACLLLVAIAKVQAHYLMHDAAFAPLMDKLTAHPFYADEQPAEPTAEEGAV